MLEHIKQGVWLREWNTKNPDEFRVFYVTKVEEEIIARKIKIKCFGEGYELNNKEQTVRKFSKAIFVFPKEKIIDIEILKGLELQKIENKIKNFAILQELEKE